MNFNMKRALFFLLALIVVGGQWSVVNGREVTSLNQEWQFRKGTFGVWGVYPNIFVPKGEKVVNLPHTYNDEDFMNDGGYYRGEGSYMKEIDVPESWKGKRIFVKFEGAGSVANVQVNWVQVGEHKGAYNAFTFELTDYLTYGQKNYLLVTCDNSHRFDVATLSGDFNVYGGLYRDAWLYATINVIPVLVCQSSTERRDAVIESVGCHHLLYSTASTTASLTQNKNILVFHEGRKHIAT